jgi:hypothetical protein
MVGMIRIRKRAVRKYTNWGVMPPPSLAPYAYYIKDEVEEARALADALAASAEAAATKKKAKEAERHAALQAVAAFQEREAAREQRLAAVLGEFVTRYLPT